MDTCGHATRVGRLLVAAEAWLGGRGRKRMTRSTAMGLKRQRSVDRHEKMRPRRSHT